MSDFLKEYAKGDIIFREGDVSNLAYIVVQGNVDIFKKGLNKPIATIASGEILGEMSAIDGEPRSCSAIAQTKVILEEIKAEELKEQLNKNKEFSFSLIQSLIKRIRETDNKLTMTQNNYIEKINNDTSREPSIKTKKNKLIPKKTANIQTNTDDSKIIKNKNSDGILNWLFNKKPSGIVNLYIPPAKGDNNNQLRSQLIDFLETIKGLSAHNTSDNNNISPSNFLQKKGGDVLIKCEIEPSQNIVKMSFYTHQPNVSTYGIVLHNSFKFCLPIDADEKMFALLKCVILGIITPKHNKQRDFIIKNISSLIMETKDAGLNPPKNITPNNVVINLISFGVCCFNLYDLVNDEKWLNLAIDIFKKALNHNYDNNPELSFNSNMLLAQGFAKLCYQSKNQEMNLAISIKHYQTAKTFAKEANHKAVIESQISFLATSLGMLSGKEDYLLEAISNAQSALKYFSLQKDLAKWSLIANNVAQTMQYYGNLYANVEYIKSSITMFNSILKTRNKDKKPLLWAETKNNIASSFFLLGKYTNKNEDFRQASEFFEESAIVYKNHRQEKKAHIALRNHQLAMKAYEKTIDKTVERNTKWRLELERADNLDEIPENIAEDEWQKEISSLNS